MTIDRRDFRIYGPRSGKAFNLPALITSSLSARSPRPLAAR